MDALSPLSYLEACRGIDKIISDLGFQLFMCEAQRQPTVSALRKQVGAYFNQLGSENRLDVLHAWDAEDKSELVENTVAQLLERVEDEEA